MPTRTDPEEDPPEAVMRSAEAVLGQLTVAQALNTVLPVARMPINMGSWADETDDNIEPRPYLEDFYILTAMQLGDPDVGAWLREKSIAFHNSYESYTYHHDVPKDDPNAILLSYIFWYQRNKPS